MVKRVEGPTHCTRQRWVELSCRAGEAERGREGGGTDPPPLSSPPPPRRVAAPPPLPKLCISHLPSALYHPSLCRCPLPSLRLHAASTDCLRRSSHRCCPRVFFPPAVPLLSLSQPAFVVDVAAAPMTADRRRLLSSSACPVLSLVPVSAAHGSSSSTSAALHWPRIADRQPTATRPHPHPCPPHLRHQQLRCRLPHPHHRQHRQLLHLA